MNKLVNYSQRATVPTMFITKNKQRLKQFKHQLANQIFDTIYLNNGDEFELELFNPTSSKILAKIKINDNYLESGIVLRPGERVFLERYLNEARKFIFETYDVDKDDPNVNEAIKNNGKVEVEFYAESVNYSYYGNTNITYYPYYYSSSDTTIDENVPYTLTSSGGCTNSYCYSQAQDNNSVNESLETGRVEKGSHSNQNFNSEYSDFQNWYFSNQVWIILPKSRKVYRKEELEVYCTNCSAKRKKSSHRFCPHCGVQYS